MKRSGKRLLAVFLCLSMALTLLPIPVMARQIKEQTIEAPDAGSSAAVKAELPAEAPEGDDKAELSAGTVYPDAAEEAWAQHDVTVKGNDGICNNAKEDASGHLHLKASASNGKDGGSTSANWPAVFRSATMNNALEPDEDGNYTVSFKMKFNTVNAFGVFINYTDPSKGFFLGYNNGAWYSQRYGVDGINWTDHNSSTPVAGTVYTAELSWDAENHTASFKMQTEDGETVLTNMTNDSYADLVAVAGIETVNNFALVAGKYGGNPADIEVWDIHYSGQATIPAYNVTGTVSDEKGAGLADVEVKADNYTATTSAQGNYTLTLPSGTYTLTATKNGYITATKNVTVGSADLTGQNMTMEVSHTVDIPVDAAEDITNWTKEQGTGASTPALDDDGRLVLMAGENNGEKPKNGSAAIYTNSTINSELKAENGKKWISFKLIPTSVKSNPAFAEDYLGFGITLNYNGQTGSSYSGYYIGFCTHSGTNNTSENGVNHDGLFWQEWNASSQPYDYFSLPGGLKSGQEMEFYIEWTDTTILMKINDNEVALGSNQMTAIGDNITNKIAFSMGGGNTFKDTTLQNVVIQTQLTLWDIHYSGQTTEKGHTVAGTVKDDHDEPLSGAVVSTGKYTATTDTNGKYNMILPEAASAYTVKAELDGYTTATKSVTVNETSDYRVLEATDFTLPLLPVISGTVVDKDGKGIFGASVSSDKRPEGSAVATDAQGKFTIIGAVDGEHTLTVSAEGYETKDNVKVTVNGQDVTGVEIELEDRQIPSYTLEADGMNVTVAQFFPQVIQYTLKGGDLEGKTMYGQTAELDTIKINGKDVKLTPEKVTSVLDASKKKVTYTMVIDSTNNNTTGVTATITAEIRVGLDDINEKDSAAAGCTLGFYITDVTYDNNDRLDHPVDTIEIPNHSLVSVRGADAMVTGAKLADNTFAGGDTTYAATDKDDGYGENFFAAFVYNDELSAGLASNSAYGSGTAGSGTYPVRAQFESKDGGSTMSVGLGSVLWYYDHDITQNEPNGYKKLTEGQLSKEQRIIEPLDMPYAKVVITGEMNDNGKVDWQDGAIAYRETVMHIPAGGEQVANTANLRISMNFGSMATNPFLIALENVKRVSAHTDGLGQFVLLKGYAGEGHDSNHPQYDNIGIRMGGPEDLKTLLEEGEKLGAAFGVHVNASEFYAEAITNEDQVLRYSGNNMRYGWNWLDQGISINAVYDYASGLRAERWDDLYEIVQGHPFTVYVDVWGNNTSGAEDDFQTRALSNEIISYPGWRIAHEWAWANPYESTFQHWATDYTYGNYSQKGKLNSNVLRFILNQYKDSFPPDFATYGGASNAPLLGGPAMQGFEGWQQDGEYNLSIYNTFNQMVYTKFLQHYSVTEWINATKAVKMAYNGDRGSRTSEADWTPEVQIKLAGDGDEIVVTRGTTGKIMTDATLNKMNTAAGFLANETEYRSRVVTLNGKVIVTGAPASAGEDNAFPASKATLKYLIPWYWKVDGERVAPADEKLYHWNAQGGQSTWDLPDGWEDLKTVIVYELSDQGRGTGKTVKVIGGKITLTAEKDTCYVVTKGTAADNTPVTVNNEPVIEYGTGLHLKDPSFNLDTARNDSPWTVEGKGSAIHTTNSEGIGVLKMTGEVSVSQKMEDLKGGTNYVSYVAVDNRSSAKASITITDITDPENPKVVATNYTTRSIAKNYVSSYYLHNNHGMEAGASYFQNMFVYFTPEEDHEYTMTLSREAGAGSVYFDDLRTVEYGFDYKGFGNEQTPQNEKGTAEFPVEYVKDEKGNVTSAISKLEQDFENVPQGIWPFVVGPVEGVNDNRTHVSELNDPFTQAGWDVKKLDDVIDGNWSVKVNGLAGRNSVVFQTIPQNFRFEPNQTYTVSFDYELGSAGCYYVVIGDGESTNYTSVPLSQTLNTTVPNNSGIAGNTTAKATVNTCTFSVSGAASGQTWIGIFSSSTAPNLQGTTGAAAAFGGYQDFVLDNLSITLNVGDLGELNALLIEAKSWSEVDYKSSDANVTDEAAWAALKSAITAAQTVVDAANESGVAAAKAALETAMDGLEEIEVVISGKVTGVGGAPLANAVVTLEDHDYYPMGLTVTTGADGTFEFRSTGAVPLHPLGATRTEYNYTSYDIHNVVWNTTVKEENVQEYYRLKVQATGYQVQTVTASAVTKDNPKSEDNDIALVSEGPGAYVNDFNEMIGDGSEGISYGTMGNLLNEDELKELGELTAAEFDALTDSQKTDYLKATAQPTMQWVYSNGSGALQVTFNAGSGETRTINNVVDKASGAKIANGSISYDVTALNTGLRFGLTLRATATDKRVFMGQEDNPTCWFWEWWNPTSTPTSSYSSYRHNFMTVEPGITRNVRVELNGQHIQAFVDGIEVYNVNMVGAPAEAGFAGINMRLNKGSQFVIDNIRVISNDPSEAGTYTIAGSVKVGTQSIPGAVVSVYNADDELVTSTTTNAEGAYKTTALEAGTYKMEITATDYTKVTEGSVTIGANITGKNFTLSVDDSRLQTIYKDNKEKKEADYTPETWSVFADALAAAKTVLENATHTAVEVNKAYNDLYDAVQALKVKEEDPVDFSGLRKLHKDMANEPNNNYTNSTWEKFQKALEAARQMLLAGTATEDEVKAMEAALQKAFDDLEEATPADEMDLTALQAAYDAAKDVEKGNATEANWAKFEEARDAALAILSNSDGLTQAEVDAAARALTDAQNGLHRSSSRPATTTTTGTRDDGSTVTTVTDNRTGTVTETVEQPDGTKTETVTNKAGDVTITVTDPDGEELAKVEIPAEVPASDTTFVDTTDHWAKESIDKMAALKLVKGVGEDKYKPTDSMTRGSLATVLHRLSQGKTDYATTFRDVDNKEWYAAGVAWAAKADVVRGVSDDLFAPDQIITREQLATMLCRYAKLIGMNTKADAKSLESFVDDSKIGGWAVDSMAWCVENGILQGKGQNNLDPTADVTRAEVAVMLDRFISLIK